MDKAYIETVRLLLESVPIIFDIPHFAMKGGTAINLFIEDCHGCPWTLTWCTPITRPRGTKP